MKDLTHSDDDGPGMAAKKARLRAMNKAGKDTIPVDTARLKRDISKDDAERARGTTRTRMTIGERTMPVEHETAEAGAAEDRMMARSDTLSQARLASRLKKSMAADDSTYKAERSKVAAGTDDTQASAKAAAAFKRGSARADSLAGLRKRLGAMKPKTGE